MTNTLSGLPEDLPWDRPLVALLLDGTTFPDVRSRFAACQPDAPRIALYAGTRFEAISDISPLVVVFERQSDPAFQLYLEQAAQEWGSLLFSSAPMYVLVEHLRKLLTVHVPDGPEVVLRLADPAIANALLSVPTRDECLFGPIETWVIPDCLTGGWHRHQRHEFAAARLPIPYVLSDEQNTALDDADLRRAALKLDAHLLEHFPNVGVEPAPERRAKLVHHVKSVYGLGFTSQSDLSYYGNVLGWLGGLAVADHPEIFRLLAQPSTQPPSARMAAAAELARTWAQARQADKDRP